MHMLYLEHMKRSDIVNIWINKCIQEEPVQGFENSYVFNITNKADSTIKSDIKDIWFDLGCLQIDSIYEDMYIIALIVFAIDKKFSRRNSNDAWTRSFNVSIPVVNIQQWNRCKDEWEKMLRFLSGDVWSINFRASAQRYYKNTNRTPPSRVQGNYDCLCLFSGGLDSFCGAIKLLEERKAVCFVGYKEYPKLGARQKSLYDILEHNYPEYNKKLINFTASPRAPILNGELSNEEENTSRSRSLLFICGALTIANILGGDIPLYIPENGFIGLNVPLTSSRKGSCSTRTTHVNFINRFENILNAVGINNKIENFFAFSSKKDVVNMVQNTAAFIEGVERTISCSHPCLPRYSKTGDREYPLNCGYCYPCLIRKSSIKHLNLRNDRYTEPNSIAIEFLNSHNNFDDKASDVRAVLTAVYKYKDISDEELKRIIMCTGEVSASDVEKFMEVFRNSINDLIDLLPESSEMEEYMGLHYNEQTN